LSQNWRQGASFRIFSDESCFPSQERGRSWSAFSLFIEECRRLKIIPNAFGERAVLKLMFRALIRAAKRWRSVKVNEFERRQLAAAQKSSIRNTKPRSASKQSRQTMMLRLDYPAILGLDR
jgi:hypothetical protein